MISDLKEIVSKLEKLNERDQQATEAKASNTPWGWIFGLLISAVVVIGAAIAAWQLNKKNKELAKLRTKIEVDTVRAEQLQFEADNNIFKHTSERRAREAEQLRIRVHEDKATLKEAALAYEQAVEQLGALGDDWDALDRYNRDNHTD